MSIKDTKVSIVLHTNNVGWKIFAYSAPMYSNPYLHPLPFLFLLYVYEFISLWTWKFGNVQFSKKLRGKYKNPE